MKYELTKELETGNTLIDSEHRQLFQAVNDMMDACSGGKGRDQIEKTVNFLVEYVSKHFGDEEKLQIQTKYPGYNNHKAFHEKYKADIKKAAQALTGGTPSIAALGQVNQQIAVLVSHIKTEDKKLALHVKGRP